MRTIEGDMGMGVSTNLGAASGHRLRGLYLLCMSLNSQNHNMATQRRQSPNSATVALFCDSVDRL